VKLESKDRRRSRVIRNIAKIVDKENLVPIQNIRKRAYGPNKLVKKATENYQPIRHSKLASQNNKEKTTPRSRMHKSPVVRKNVEKSLSYISNQEARKRQLRRRISYKNKYL
jgi:hypothetical protein